MREFQIHRQRCRNKFSTDSTRNLFRFRSDQLFAKDFFNHKFARITISSKMYTMSISNFEINNWGYDTIGHN